VFSICFGRIRGLPSEVVLNEEDGMKFPCAVNLPNAVTVSQQRPGKRVAQLSSARMNEVCATLRFSLGCDSHSLLGKFRLSSLGSFPPSPGPLAPGLLARREPTRLPHQP